MATDEESPLVAELQPQPLNHKRDVYLLCWAFLLVFLAYGAVQNLESTMNTEGDLGTISLGILYVSFAVFSLVASMVVKKLGSKNALVLGTTGYWLFIAANLKPSWFTMVPASLYLGFAASIIWVGQGTYLTSTANSHANENNLHEGTVIGKFNGVFWGMFACHQLVGNLITLALLRDEGGTTSGTTLLLIVFLISMTLGTILMCFLSKRNGKEERLEGSVDTFSSSVGSLVTSMLNLLLDIRILLIIPLIAYSGLQQAFVWAEYTKEIVNPVLGEQGVGGAMAIYGVFDAISSLAAGRLTSDLSSITLIVSGGVFIQLIVLLWLLLNYSVTGGLLGTLLPLLIGALWGIGDGVLNTQLSALLGILFKHDLEGAFAQLKLWQSASIAVVFFISTSISFQAMLIIMLVALCISVAGFLFLTLNVEKAFARRAS
ncbi:Major facilitator superfamily protein [Perilla frutescens var. hirtella]|uniref:Major facilitator superfamily protein n=1 Tax=Perilla frutescens var. hirtella TaxID=608512 RepID=A0AAD4J4E6_PERFH|nr:Major facilitator superfamily protein [Perilla frutescens var. hirtella]KAH6805902.1 Major facilitator superfamily protein [Perilla frutescens var. frutescens]KAH6826440.1 Major facilitator superfamily protein [Perilla frutescens var. hirtella]